MPDDSLWITYLTTVSKCSIHVHMKNAAPISPPRTSRSRVTNSPARISPDAGAGDRFWYWFGASGERYIHSVYGLAGAPLLTEDDESTKVPGVFLVGFKAEFNVSDEDLIERAYGRLKTAGMDLIVANDVSRAEAGFGTETNEVFIVDPERSVTHIPLTGKDEIAGRLLTMIREKLDGDHPPKQS